jgi:pseudouridine kinase
LDTHSIRGFQMTDQYEIEETDDLDRTALVIGAAGLDMVGRLKEPPKADDLPTARPVSANIRVSFGGVGRNVAENLARLGQPVRLLTAVGRDQTGERLLAQTALCGVDVRSSVKSERFHTGSYMAVFDPEGRRYFTLEDMGVLEEITPAYILESQEWVSSCKIMFVDANLPVDALATVIQLAKQAQIMVCADTTSVLLAERLLPYLEMIYMLTANSSEATVLCQNEPVVTDRDTALQAARKLVNLGVELAVISLAEFGVVYATSETSGHIPAIKTRIIDPTGAGDALTATLIFGLLNEIPIDESVRLGVTAASLILRHRGTVFTGLSLERLYDELVA